jgi:alcohol dehydrogenase class IV
MDALVTGAAARDDLLYGAFLGGLVFAGARSGLHHKICHIVGGAFDLPHAPLHAVILPPVLEFTAPAAPEAAARIAGALGTQDAVGGLRDLYRRAGIPRSLQEIGMLPHHLEPAIDRVVAALPIAHVRTVDAAAVRHILTRAYEC